MQTDYKKPNYFGYTEKNSSKNQTDPFEFQNWDVYRRSVKMVKACRDIAMQSTNIGVKGFCDQLTRVSLSIPLNIAKGYSRYGKKEKLNYFRIAKGSLFECVACLDVLDQLQALDPTLYKQMKIGMGDIGKMLSGLIRKIEERENK